jgi:hypothetical protein
MVLNPYDDLENYEDEEDIWPDGWAELLDGYEYDDLFDCD